MTRINRRHNHAVNGTGVKVKGLRPVKPTRERRRPEIDADALAATLAELDEKASQRNPVISGGSNVLPATGSCHECERPVSGERRFCGRCMSKRRT